MNDLRYQVEVTAKPTYKGQQNGHYAFAYEISIHNAGSFSAQLLNRHWLITDGNGKTEEVKGPGVIGEQPVLVPGDTYTYTSGALLKTEVGSMRGQFEMQADDGHRFMAPIRAFTLAVPGALN
ncbi:Co2+/Mg2+ efflux protein ApaG [Litorivicinus lipolyticus]|uniref:Co2+/Mg2+ efflux protein ApaG n=1 Tax=Litorivicinus lipolyticus TaxID=418701 RepID=UPI003B5A2EA6